MFCTFILLLDIGLFALRSEAKVLLPAVQPHVDLGDYQNLVPNTAYSLFYAGRDADAGATVGVIHVPQAEYPSVQLQTSKYVASTSCEGDIVHVTFADDEALSTAETAWKNEPFILILYQAGCGEAQDDPTDRSFHLVNKITNVDDTNLTLSLESTLLDLATAVGDKQPVKIVFGPTTNSPSSSSETRSLSIGARSAAITPPPSLRRFHKRCDSWNIFCKITSGAASVFNGATSELPQLEASAMSEAGNILDRATSAVQALEASATSFASAAEASASNMLVHASLSASQLELEAQGDIGAATSEVASLYAVGTSEVNSLLSVARASGSSILSVASSEGESVLQLATASASSLFASITSNFPKVTETIAPGPTALKFDTLNNDSKSVVDTPWHKPGYLLKHLEKDSASVGDLSLDLYCVDCGIHADLQISGSISMLLGLEPAIHDAWLDITGSMGADMSLGIVAEYNNTWSIDEQLFDLPIPEIALALGEALIIGPSIEMDIGGDLTIDLEGRVLAGVGLTWPSILSHFDFVNTSSSNVSGFDHPNIQPVLSADASIDVVADVYVMAELKVGVDINIASFKKHWDVGLVDKPALVLNTSAAIAAGLESDGELGAGFSGRCPGVDVDLYFRNDVYLDVLDEVTLTFNHFTTPIFTSCFTIGQAYPTAGSNATTTPPSVPAIPTACTASTGPIYTPTGQYNGKAFNVVYNADILKAGTLYTGMLGEFNNLSQGLESCNDLRECVGATFDTARSPGSCFLLQGSDSTPVLAASNSSGECARSVAILMDESTISLNNTKMPSNLTNAMSSNSSSNSSAMFPRHD